MRFYEVTYWLNDAQVARLKSLAGQYGYGEKELLQLMVSVTEPEHIVDMKLDTIAGMLPQIAEERNKTV